MSKTSREAMTHRSDWTLWSHCESLTSPLTQVPQKASKPAYDEQVKASSPSAEPPKPKLHSPSSVGLESFPPAGLRQARGYAATTAPENAKNVQATDPYGEAPS